MRLKDLIKRNNWKRVKDQAVSIGLSKEEVGILETAFINLKKINSYVNIENVTISMNVDGYYELKPKKMHVFGYTDLEEEIDLSFYQWSEWLAFDIDPNLNYLLSEAEILVHCLREMITWGISDEEINENTGLGKVEEYIKNKEENNVVFLLNSLGE